MQYLPLGTVTLSSPADFPPLKSLDTHPNNLPIQPTPFIGREQEVAAVAQLLPREEVRLLTLTGPGGIGKTRLALQVATQLSGLFPDGVYFVNLAPIRDSALVVPTIAQTLNLKENAEQPVFNLLKAFIRKQRLLLLLDNFEQVVSAATQVADLLISCPQLKVLVTSRMTLHVRTEQEFVVPALSMPDTRHLPDLMALSQYEAVALFIQRTQAVKPEFQLSNATALAVAEICKHLDGLPLAIELAAARIKLLPPQALLARLTPRLTILSSGARDAPERQQTLRNTIAWSYQLLDALAQRLFRRLSVFVGGCTLQAIEEISAALDGEAEQVLEVVASLVDQSLLQQTEQEGKEPHLMMLETIREYGMEALEASGEVEVTRQAHATYYLRLAEEAEPELVSPQQATWLERLEREHDNLRAAMQWLLAQEGTEQEREMALRLGGALLRFWEVRGHWSEGWNFLEWARAGNKGAAVPAQVKVLMAAAYLLDHLKNDTDHAQALYEESLEWYRELGDTAGIAHALLPLGEIAGRRGNVAVAYSRIEEALALFRAMGDKRGIALSLTNLADVVSQQEEYARAISLNEESLELFRTLGDMEGIAWSLNYLPGIVSREGEYIRAISLNEESLELFRTLGNMEGIIWSLFGLARVLFLSQGDPAQVHTLLEEGLVLSREVGHKLGIAQALSLLGEVFLKQGNAAKARSLLEEGLRLYREGRDQRGIAESLSLLARVGAHEGDATEQSPVSPKKSAAAYPDGLTAREVEVLRLVASGLSNTQVSERLVISPRTVDTHLTSIYSKIGVSSRSAATRYALEHHLI
jgi:predicted ATPase/DNA-binding NarL/FixJ family response regulator